MSKRFFFILIALMAAALVGCDGAQNVLKDPRDGKTYKTVQIGTQTWMAENLNYEIADSYCYNNDTSNCKKYGRFYTRDAALKVCPAGWHLPSMDEFDILIKTVGGEKIAGEKLKSKSGWNDGGNGSDAFGFSALPAGVWFDGEITGDDAGFSEMTVGTGFWGSTENANEELCEMNLVDADNAPYFNYRGRGFGNSVRCIKD